ncbi:transcriptional regulator [Bacillus sp. AFS002410]|nr:transcriptional regulator [Bacillus sp. AFS002410]
MSQKRAAEIIMISNVQLSRYESGDRNPDFETLKLLADLYEVTIDYLLGVSKDAQVPDKVENNIYKEWPQGVQVLQRANEKLSEKNKNKVLKVIQAFIDEEDED